MARVFICTKRGSRRSSTRRWRATASSKDAQPRIGFIPSAMKDTSMETYTRQVSQVTDLQDDSNARDLLRQAFDRTARWPANFGGFSASLLCHDNGVEQWGTVKVTMPRTVEVSLPEAGLQQWAQQQLAMLAGHRAYRTFDEADGKYV